MKKLIKGILDFRSNCLSHYLENFSHLAKGQAPDAILLTCSDSRVAPHIFASTNPGDVFVLRNMGNIIPNKASLSNCTAAAEAAAISFALRSLPIKDIIVCGHSDCGAMRALLSGKEQEDPFIKTWLSHCNHAVEALKAPSIIMDPKLALHNQLSQLNVLQQITHLKTYPIVREKIEEGKLRIHGWYFDLAQGDVYNFEEKFNRFVLIDEEEALRILNQKE